MCVVFSLGRGRLRCFVLLRIIVGEQSFQSRALQDVFALHQLDYLATN